MDISHFGLFDLTGHQPRWTGQPGFAPEDRVVPLARAGRCVANDNNKRDATRTFRAGFSRRPNRYKTMFRLILHRTEPGQA